MSNELKVVITLKDGRGFIGIKSPDCDPILSVFEGDLPAALEMVPGLVQQAQEKWAESPQYPKGEVPAPPAPKTPPRQTVATKAAAPKSSVKPQLF